MGHEPRNPNMAVAILLAALGAVAVAPTASADHIRCRPSPVYNTCIVAAGAAHGALGYVECFPNTAPVDWGTDCL